MNQTSVHKTHVALNFQCTRGNEGRVHSIHPTGWIKHDTVLPSSSPRREWFVGSRLGFVDNSRLSAVPLQVDETGTSWMRGG